MESRLPPEVIESINGYLPRDRDRSSPTGVIMKEAIKQAEPEIVAELMAESLRHNLHLIQVDDSTPGAYRVRIDMDVFAPTLPDNLTY
jgi:hypothetical protein